MADLYASNSGFLLKSSTSSWSDARDNASADSAYDSPAGGQQTYAMAVLYSSGRGGSTYTIRRSFLWFDTSGITGTVSSATLKIYGYGSGTSDVIAVKSTAYGGDGSASLVTSDFNNFATGSGNDYSSEISTWSISGYNDITLNATALANIKNNDVLIVCLMEYDYDHQNQTPGSLLDVRSGMYYDNEPGTSKDPYIDYTLQTGYANDVIGVATGSIGKVIGVATASIEKVIGV
jgi:hypothetical protein